VYVWVWYTSIHSAVTNQEQRMAVNCNFARTVIHHFTPKFMKETKQNSLWFNDSYFTRIQHPFQWNAKPYNNVQCCIKEIPSNHKEFFICGNQVKPSIFTSTFSISEWNALAPEEKTNHTLRDCQVSNQVSAPEHPLLKLYWGFSASKL